MAQNDRCNSAAELLQLGRSFAVGGSLSRTAATPRPIHSEDIFHEPIQISPFPGLSKVSGGDS
jgi:hypothetical protein